MNNTAALHRASHFEGEQGPMLSAVATLLLGSAVYVLECDWSSAMFLGPFVYYQWPKSAVFGRVGDILTSLM